MCGQPLPRGSGLRTAVLRVGGLVLNPETYDASRAGKEITLSRTEFRLLECLMQCSGRTVSRGTLVQLVWDSSEDVEENTLDVFIHKLRSKVDRDHKAKLIKTVRKLGYAIRVPTLNSR